MLTDCFKSFTLFLILICFAFHATFSCIKGELGKKRKKYEHLKKNLFFIYLLLLLRAESE